jgi:radical SAM family uncharacterized protein/radical SAM-linked protein
MSFSRERYERLLGRVEKPGRYLGNERGVVRKDLDRVALRFALAFPEVYEIAQSHPGLQILYDLLNRRDDIYAERVYAPWLDLEALLRANHLPLVSLETFTPLRDFDVIGFSLQYELTYTNLLAMLELGGIALEADDRDASAPLIIAGGPCAFNPEPLAPFLDAVLLGDGEQAVYDICDTYLQWDGEERGVLLEALGRVDGVYVPSLYEAEYVGGRLAGVRPRRPDIPAVVEKRVLKDLDSVPLPQTHVVPTIKVVHGRPNLEVMRGCVKGCRFCQAGYIYRPLRERDPQRVLQQAKDAVRATGTDELSLLSLSTGDYSCVNPVLTELMNQFAEQRVAVSLPSTRVDALAPSLLEQIRRVRKTGFTLAPDAGSQRMRDIIQKEYQEEELIEAARQIFDLGWRSVKLYFMLGLPGETRDDLIGIVDLAAKVKAAGAGRCEVTASVSTFVPKAHTPFQWAAQIDVAETEERQSLLRRELSRRRLRFKWHDARTSYLEGIFSRGDRRVARLLRAAYDLGCRFDGWTEYCRFDLWEQALAQTGLDPAAYLGRRHLNEALPWDHLSSGVTKSFLQRELAHAVEGRLTPDCSVERCTYCGACDFKTVRNVDYHLRGAKGSEHRGGRIDNWAQVIVGEEDAEAWEPRGWRKIRERVENGTREDRRHPGAAVARTSVPENGVVSTPSDATAGLGNAEEWLAAAGEGLAAPPSAPAPALQRIRCTYSKTGAARFISHLELIDVFTRALRRATLPVAYSAGHHPQPRLRFSPGLPVGAESDCEVVDVDFTHTLPVEDFRQRFAGQLPEGLTILDVREVSLREPSPDQGLRGFRYLIDVDSLVDGDDGADLDRRLAEFAGAATFPVRKRRPRGDKEVDACRFVTRAQRIDRCTVELDVRFTNEGSLKPSEFLAAVFDLDETTARALPLRKTTSYYDG